MVKYIICTGLVVFILGCNSSLYRKKEHCEPIDDSIRIEGVEVVNNGVRIGDTAHIKVRYYNFSDSIIELSTRNHIFISNPDVGGSMNYRLDSMHHFFSFDSLSTQLIKVKILPKQSYFASYKIKFFSPVFEIGINNVRLISVGETYDTRNKRKYLCGHLVSPIFQVTIKE